MGFFSSESKVERNSKHAENKKSSSSSKDGSFSNKGRKSEIAHTLKYAGKGTSNTVKSTKKGLFNLFG